MVNYIFICFILAILGTYLVNPAFYHSIYDARKSFNKDLAEYNAQIADNNNRRMNPPDRNNRKYRVISIPLFVISQSITFIIGFTLSMAILYFIGTVNVSWTTVLAYLWIPAIFQMIEVFTTDDGCSSFDYNYEDSIHKYSLIFLFIFVIIPICIGAHKGIYNYLHPYNNFAIMSENYQDVPNVDDSVLLEKADLASNASLGCPIYRNDAWIYPVISSSDHVTSAGYLIVEPNGENIKFVSKQINYSPWIYTKNNVRLVARRYLPKVVFFGTPTMQIDPETGDIYFCQFYGRFASFRAGREINGAILVNAETGECKKYYINDWLGFGDTIPDWVTGVVF